MVLKDKICPVCDEEIKRIVSDCMVKAQNILADNIDILHRLSKILLEREILDSEEIDKIIRGEELPPIKKNGASEAEKKEDEIPEHVVKLLEKKKQKESLEKDDAN